MLVREIFIRRLAVAEASLVKDGYVTRQYFYVKCYPIFKSICNRCYMGMHGVVRMILW